MKTLLEHYRQNQPELQRKLQSADRISEISEILQDEVRRLADINGEYIGSLTKPQARVALSMLEAFRLSFSMLAIDQMPLIGSTHHIPDTDEHVDDDHIKSLWGGFVGGALGGTITGGVIGGTIGGVVGAFGATVALKTIHLVKPSPESKDVSSPTKSLEINSTGVALDKKELLVYLEQTFNVIDDTVAEYSRLSEPVESKPKLEDHPEMLEFIQNLIGETLTLETQLPPIFQLRIKELSSILRKYGIRSQIYQDNAPDTVKELFDFEPSLDPNLQNNITAKPALTKGDQILLRGRVIEPSSSEG
jgi:hypothetical protein